MAAMTFDRIEAGPNGAINSSSTPDQLGRIGGGTVVAKTYPNTRRPAQLGLLSHKSKTWSQPPRVSGLRRCRVCLQTKPTTEFQRVVSKKSGKDRGWQSWCSGCVSEGLRRWRKKQSEKIAVWRKVNPDRIRLHSRKRRLKVLYSMSTQDYEARVSAQGGACAICRTAPRGDRPLYVDHCHKSGEVRELLCSKCNQGIGCFGDNPSLLIAASEYLKNHQRPVGIA